MHASTFQVTLLLRCISFGNTTVHFLMRCYEFMVVVYAITHESVGSRMSKSPCGSGGIRTRASEETGALNQRLRPLGHATGTSMPCTGLRSRFTGQVSPVVLSINTTYFVTKVKSTSPDLILTRHLLEFLLQNVLSEAGFEPAPTFVDQKALYACIQASLRLSLAP